MDKHQHNEGDSDLIKRMNYLIGHLQGVKRMVEGGEYCVDIMNQNQGVISALRKVNQQLLDRHLNSCVVDAIRGSKSKERREKISELLEIFGGVK